MLKLIFRRGLPLLVICLLVLVVAASLVGEIITAQELVYVSQGRSLGREEHIRWMDVERGLAVAITDMFLEISSQLQWTSDGENLIFAANTGQSSEVYYLNLKTDHLDRLTAFDDNNQMRITEAVLSSDGQKIAFLREDVATGPNQIYMMNVNGSDLRQVVQNPGNYSALNWSPTRQQLIFTALSIDGPELWLLDLSNSESGFTRLIMKEEAMNQLRPHWLNGEQIGVLAIVTQSDISSPYLLLNIETGEINQMLEDGSFVQRGVWSQDGTKLVYSTITPSANQQPESQSMFLLDAINGESKQIAELTTDATIASLHWSRDESLVAATTIPPSVLVIRLADGQIIQSTRLADQRAFSPAWRP